MSFRTSPFLALSLNGREVLRAGISTTVGRAILAGAHPDARFLADAQFRLKLDPARGDWFVEPMPGAQNETLLDGACLIAPMQLRSGSVIAVGNSRKGVVKLPLTVSTGRAAASGAGPADATNTAEPVRSEVEAPALVEDPTLDLAPEPSRHEGPAIPWARAFEVVRTVGAVAGRVLLAALAGAGGSGNTGNLARVRRGQHRYGDVLLTVSGAHAFEGPNPYGPRVLTISGNKVFRGADPWGEVLVNVDGDLVREGAAAWGDVIASLDGDLVREGRGRWGDVLANVDGRRSMAGAAAAAYLLAY